jgi:hypothetical protein
MLRILSTAIVYPRFYNANNNRMAKNGLPRGEAGGCGHFDPLIPQKENNSKEDTQ